MLNIYKLRYTYEKPFLDLMEGMERKIHPDEPHKTLWYKNNEWYFERNEENGRLWCQTYRVWKVFEREYGGNYTEIQTIIKSLMERHYNLRDLTPCHAKASRPTTMERHYNLRDLTPITVTMYTNYEMERHYKLKGLIPYCEKKVVQPLMERHYKLNGLTPGTITGKPAFRMERHYKLKNLIPF